MRVVLRSDVASRSCSSTLHAARPARFARIRRSSGVCATRDDRIRSMPRDLVIGNGCMLVGFDAQYRLADFYFPHVGMENHAASRFRFGVCSDGKTSWIEDPPWRRQLTYLRDTLVTDVTCENPEMGLRLRCYDTVDVDRN